LVDNNDNGDELIVRDDVTGRKKIRPLNKTKLSKEDLEDYLLDIDDEL
jgi:hypothetical protein